MNGTRRKQPIYRKVRDDLARAIERRNLLPGHPIPSENELAGRYRISRPTVRKALDLLERDGLVIRRPGKPRTVADPAHRTSLRLAINVFGSVHARPSAYAATLMNAIAEAGFRENHELRLIPGKEIENLDITNLDGLIWVHGTPGQQKVAARLASSNFPVMLVNRTYDAPYVNYVATNHRRGAFLAADYLVRCGHRRILYLGPDSDEWPYTERMQGYTDALAAAGLTVDPDLCLRFSDPNDQVRTQLSALVGSRTVTAVFNAAGDTGYLALLSHVYAEGLRIPDDLSVICFDEMAHLDVYPAHRLTCVRQPLERLGERAVAAIVRSRSRQGTEDAAETREILAPELVVRESCAPPPPDKE